MGRLEGCAGSVGSRPKCPRPFQKHRICLEQPYRMQQGHFGSVDGERSRKVCCGDIFVAL